MSPTIATKPATASTPLQHAVMFDASVTGESAIMKKTSRWMGRWAKGLLLTALVIFLWTASNFLASVSGNSSSTSECVQHARRD